VTDLPLLELVGHPVVTNPDPRLYRVAVRRHWPVRFFKPPEKKRSLAEDPPSPGAVVAEVGAPSEDA
jgi:hypothetical protein